MSLTTPIKTDPAKRSGTVRRAGAHRSSGRPFDWSHRRRAPELALTVGLLILALLQRPGRIVRDTKLDLAIDPGHFMASVTHLWDPLASFGSVPDQASGYLFPMGSFYWLGASLRVPEWIIQRVWLALLLAAAVWGTILLAEALRIGGRWSRLAGGAAYALSPLVLAQIHDTSYVLPAVLLPWVMLPLVRASQGTLTSPGGAARSGLAVLLMGGTNATATLAVLLLPVIWFATRRPIRAHIRLFGLWVLALVLATAWFVVPLLFQQKYGFNFVPYTETSSVTTQLSYLPELLRGGGDWTSLSNPPIWSTAGFMIEMSPVVIAVSSLLAGLGLWGLARRNLPDRMFLVLATVIATVLVGVGYWGHLGGPFHSTVHTLLDGRLSAFRNVVKFQPVITLAVVLGLIHTLEQFSGALRKLRWPRVDPLMSGLMVATTLIVAVTAAPLFTGKIYPGGSFTAIPSYWYQATNWINDHGAMSNTLVVPGTAFARFNWGNTLDQPFEPLADVPWANRNEVPLSSIGNTQFLDAIDNVLASGQPVPGLADYLARAGVRYLVVENDLNAAESVSPSPVSVRSVLANEAGINRVARFGPTVHQANAGLGAEHVYDPHGQTRGIQSLEVYRVGPTSSGDALVTTYPASSGIRLSGGAQGLLPLAGSGQLDHQAVALTGDPLAPMFPTTTPVVADSQQLRDTALTNLYNQVSYLLAPGQPAPNGGGKPSQWIVVPGTSHETVSVLHGAATVSASSYGPVFEDVPGDQPLSPFLEDSGGASWEAQPNDPRPWIEIRFDHAVPLHAITLTPSAKSSRVTAVQVSTDQGQVTSSLTKGTGPQSVPTAPGSTRFLRVTIVGMEGHRGILSAGPGFSHIGIPGIAVTQSWQVPDDQPATTGITPTYLFSSPLPNQFQLFRNPDEEPSMSRTFTLPTAGTFSIAGLATPRATRALRVAEFPPPGKPAASAADLRAPFAVACGSGPTLMIDGSPYQTSVTGTVGGYYALRAMTLTVCTTGGTTSLASGVHTVMADDGSSGFKVTSLSLAGTAVRTANPPRAVTIDRWAPESRTLTASAGRSALLNVHQNYNPGWVATVNGHQLRSVRLDGWQQAWELPASGSSQVVTMRFVPQSSFRTALLVGLVLAVVLVVWALLPARRRRRRRGGDQELAPTPRVAEAASEQPGAGVGIASRDTGSTVRRWLGLVLASAALFVVAGPVAFAVPLVALVWWYVPSKWYFLSWVALLAEVLAGVVIAIDPHYRAGPWVGSGSYTAQALGGLAVAAVALSLLPMRQRRRGG